MIEIIIKGIFTGVVLSVMIGPVFFVLIETSIRKGVRSAMALDLGVLISDIIYILLATLFFSQMNQLISGRFAWLVQVIGGCIFLIFGILTWFKKTIIHQEKEIDISNTRNDYFLLALKGFFLNFVNPAVIFYWITVMTIGVKTGGNEDFGLNIAVFTGVILIVFFGIDILKIIGAKKLRPFITTNLLKGLNRVTAIIFVFTAIWMMLKGIDYYYHPEKIEQFSS